MANQKIKRVKLNNEYFDVCDPSKISSITLTGDITGQSTSGSGVVNTTIANGAVKTNSLSSDIQINSSYIVGADTELSETSHNLVENQAIYNALKESSKFKCITISFTANSGWTEDPSTHLFSRTFTKAQTEQLSASFIAQLQATDGSTQKVLADQLIKNADGSLTITDITTPFSGQVLIMTGVSGAGDLDDIKLNGNSIIENRVANIIVSPNTGSATGAEDLSTLTIGDTVYKIPEQTEIAWGNITGNIATQTDLQNSLALKADIEDLTDGTITVKNAENADKATKDANGNVINSTYSTVTALNTVDGKVSTIESKIPSEATASNQLADKAYVDTNGGKIDKIKINNVESVPSQKIVTLAADGTYNETTNKLATQSTVTTASSSAESAAKAYADNLIADLDVTATNLNASESIKSISETDGKISVSKQSIQISESQVTNLGTDLGNKEDKSNKVSTWSTTVNNTHYPTEKLVKDTIDTHTNNTSNPHGVTKAQVGLGNVVNAALDNTPTNNSDNYVKSGGTYTAIDTAKSTAISTAASDATTKANTAETNAKNYTDSSISTEVTNRNTAITNAINALDVDSVGANGKYLKTISETNGKISAVAQSFDTGFTSASNNNAPTTKAVKDLVDAHTTNTSNPHSVTKAQVGLGSVVNAGMDNTPTANSNNYVKSGGVATAVSDAISTAAADATSKANTAEANAKAYTYSQADITSKDSATLSTAKTYTDTKISTEITDRNTAITNAINALDVSNISGFGTNKTLKSLSETDGKIAATFQDISIASSQVNDKKDTYDANSSTVITGKGVADAIKNCAQTNAENIFTEKNLFNKSWAGGTVNNQLAFNETQYDIFTCRDIDHPQNKTAISKGFVWSQDHDGTIYSQVTTENIYYGNDNTGHEGTLTFPKYMSPGEQTIATVASPINVYQGSFTSGHQQKATAINLIANKTYIIRALNDFTVGCYNIFVAGDTDHFTRVYKGNTIVCFRPRISGVLNLFSAETRTGGTSYTGNIDIEVYDYSDDTTLKLNMPTEYIVDLSYNTDEGYNSFTQCIMDLIDDERPKKVYLHAGEYNIVNEYHEFGMPVYTGTNPTEDYPDYCAHIPTNTHVIGQGIVQIKWMPTTSEVTANESYTVAPLNVFGSCIIENVEVYCKNGRYCIHDDPLGDIHYTGAVKIYKGVKCYRYENDGDYGFNGCIGFGMDSSMHYEFIDCLFQNYEIEGTSFYMHDRCLLNKKQQLVPTIESSDVIVKNCIIATSNNAETQEGRYAVELYNERPMYDKTTGQIVNVKWTGEAYNNNEMPVRHCRVYFESTYIGGKIALLGTKANGQNICYNAYDLTLVDCNRVPVHYDDEQHNQYFAKWYDTDQQLIVEEGDRDTVNVTILPNTNYKYDNINTLNVTLPDGYDGAISSITFTTGCIPTKCTYTGNIQNPSAIANIDSFSKVTVNCTWINDAWVCEATQIKIHQLSRDYQKVEYIQSTIDSYIDLGFQPRAGFKFHLRYNMPNPPSYGGFIVGCYRQSNDESTVYENFGIYTTKNNLGGGTGKVNYTTTGYTGSSGFVGAGVYAHMYETEPYATINLYDNGYFKMYTAYNEETSKRGSGISSSAAVPLSISINGIKDNIYGCTSGTIVRFYAINYEDDQRTVELIPCYRKSDKKVGLYDVINNDFYTAIDNHEFSVGPYVLDHASTDNATIILTQGGTERGRFTLNQGHDTTINFSTGGGGSGEPNDYIKFASVNTSTNVLTLTNNVDVPITYSEKYLGTVTKVTASDGLSISGTASISPNITIASGYKLPTTSEWSSKFNVSGGTFTGAISAPGITSTSGINVTGGITATGAISTSDTIRALNGAFSIGDSTNVGMEMGYTNGTVGTRTPYFDFHTGGNNDYDVRFLISGGQEGSSGKGTMNIYAGGGLTSSGPFTAVGVTSSNGLTVSSGNIVLNGTTLTKATLDKLIALLNQIDGTPSSSGITFKAQVNAPTINTTT